MKIFSDEEIKQISEPIISPPDDLVKIYEVVLLMADLCGLAGGVGLAAIQVGLPWKMFIVLNKEIGVECFLNCEYIPEEDEKALSVEGCLSIRNSSKELRFFEINRFKSVRLKGEKLDKNLKRIPVDQILTGFDAIVVQHEIDHALKILISDIGKEIYSY